VLQHTLFTRAHPTPEQLSTLLARLGALMGQDRIGAPATVDSYRPGAFEMKPFATEHHSFVVGPHPHALERLRSSSRSSADSCARVKADPTSNLQPLASALRRCRQPVPARVAFVDGRPVCVMTDRHGFAGGAVVQCAGPWRTSGNWWAGEAGRTARAGRVGGAGWNRDEWDVVVNNGTVYRIFCDRETDAWFIDAIVD
jgi:protein ImuB